MVHNDPANKEGQRVFCEGKLGTITDANGSKFLFEPLKMYNGAPARFDLDNDYYGMSEIVYPGRGAYYTLGDNTGLVHSYIDSNNVLNLSLIHI